MLKPAILYQEELEKKIVETWHDEKYMYFRRTHYDEMISIENDTSSFHQFVSLDSNNEVIGYINYYIYQAGKSCSDFAIISFDMCNPIFAKDVMQTIHNCFYKYNFNRIEWGCYADNPAINIYRKFIKKCGGREVGVLHQNVQLMDRELHDTVLFEIMKNEYKPLKTFQKYK